MNPKHIHLLACPACQAELSLTDAVFEEARIKSGKLSDKNGHAFPIVDFIPRFVSIENYASNFSSQWEAWPELLSSYDGYKERFTKETKWSENLTGQVILEAGCGAGTFTPFATATGATVVSFDLSGGVDANYRRIGHLENVLIVQADIFAIPVKKNSCDKIFCFGVLQHTPDPSKAFDSLVNCLRPEGDLAVDIYTMPPKGHPYEILWKNKYRARKLVGGLSEKATLSLVRGYVTVMWPLVSWLASMSNPRSISLNRFFLFDDYKSRLPGMDPSRYRSFAMLDIYDFLAPKYDIPATIAELKGWFAKWKLDAVDVHPGYNGLEGRGKKKLGTIEQQRALDGN